MATMLDETVHNGLADRACAASNSYDNHDGCDETKRVVVVCGMWYGMILGF